LINTKLNEKWASSLGIEMFSPEGRACICSNCGYKHEFFKVQKVLEEIIYANGEIGLQVAAYLDGKLVIDTWAGLADQSSHCPVASETLFTSFSMSKSIVATCVHILADRGLLNYYDPIVYYWPEFAYGGKEKATISHALPTGRVFQMILQALILS